MSEDAAPRLLRIVRGEASPEEIAALTALMSAASTDGPDGPDGIEAPAPAVRGRWNDPAASMRRSWSAGPGGWRNAR